MSRQAARAAVSSFVPHKFASIPIVLAPSLRPRPARTPCLPFFRDPAHTVPTRRLYRDLLRATYRFPVPPSSGDQFAPQAALAAGASADMAPATEGRGLVGTRLRVIRDWHRRRGWTSPSQTQTFLSSQSALLTLLHNTTPTSPSYPSILSTDFAHHLSHTRRLARLSHAASARQAALSRPPHLTGGFLRPSIFNPPLPRLRPQPLGLSMMIHRRLRARERRQAKRLEWAQYARDMSAEVAMWRDLGLEERRGGKEGYWVGSGWIVGMREMLRIVDEGWEGENKRKDRMYSEGMVRRVKRAKARREGWQRDQAEARRVSAEEGEVSDRERT